MTNKLRPKTRKIVDMFKDKDWSWKKFYEISVNLKSE